MGSIEVSPEADRPDNGFRIRNHSRSVFRELNQQSPITRDDRYLNSIIQLGSIKKIKNITSLSKQSHKILLYAGFTQVL